MNMAPWYLMHWRMIIGLGHEPKHIEEVVYRFSARNHVREWLQFAHLFETTGQTHTHTQHCPA